MMIEDVSEFLDSKESNYTFFNKDASVVRDADSACAYVANAKIYYVRKYRGNLYDPHGIDGNKMSSALSKFEKVSRETFEHYIEYLQTRQRNHLTWAERTNIDV